jgi:hypothetical protein
MCVEFVLDGLASMTVSIFCLTASKSLVVSVILRVVSLSIRAFKASFMLAFFIGVRYFLELSAPAIFNTALFLALES